MHFPTILIALTTAALTSAAAIEKRGCYTGGEGWNEQLDNALSAARDFCTVKPADFDEGQGFGRCYNLSNTKRVDFNVGSISSSRRALSYDECYDGIQKEINGCGTGGSTRYTNWQYTADPNAGQC